MVDEDLGREFDQGAVRGKRLGTNYAYNTVLVLFNVLVPFLTFPYVARVLGPIGVGKVNFALSFASLFVLLGALGIPSYGMREVARARDRRVDLDRVYSELMSLGLLATVSALAAYFALVAAVPRLREQSLLLAVVGAQVMLSAFSLNWLYRGIEELRFITIRSLLFKAGSVVALFLFVKSPQDYLIYAVISVVASSGSGIVNVLGARRYVRFHLRCLDLRRHVKPVVLLFGLSVAVNAYTRQDSVLLGLLADDASVGYYSAAVKLTRLVLVAVTSLSPVLVPRVSNLLKTGRLLEARKLTRISLDFVYMLALPAIAGIELLAGPLVHVLSGTGFYPAITAMRIVAPVLLLIGLSNVIGSQILFPLGHERKLVFPPVVAAAVSLVANLLLVPKLAHTGAAIAAVAAELSALICYVVLLRSYFPEKLWSPAVWRYLVGSTAVVVTGTVLMRLLRSPTLVTIVVPVVGLGVYAAVLALLRDPAFRLVAERALQAMRVKGRRRRRGV